MNQVNLIGNLTKDPELKTTGSGLSVASFTLAVNRRVKGADGQKAADYITCVCWRQLADVVGKYLSKGSKCAVTGSIQTRSYDSQDGSKRYVTEVLVDQLDFLPSGTRTESHAGANTGAVPADGMISAQDDDLPF